MDKDEDMTKYCVSICGGTFMVIRRYIRVIFFPRTLVEIECSRNILLGMYWGAFATQLIIAIVFI